MEVEAGSKGASFGGAQSIAKQNVIYLSKTSAGKSNFFIRSSSAYGKMRVFLPCDLMEHDLCVSGS